MGSQAHHDTVTQPVDNGLALASNTLALKELGLRLTCSSTAKFSQCIWSILSLGDISNHRWSKFPRRC